MSPARCGNAPGTLTVPCSNRADCFVYAGVATGSGSSSDLGLGDSLVSARLRRGAGVEVLELVGVAVQAPPGLLWTLTARRVRRYRSGDP
jgi:hypothetical protein